MFALSMRCPCKARRSSHGRMSSEQAVDSRLPTGERASGEIVASNRYHPQPGMQCSWCQFKNERMAWLPGMTAEDVRRAA